MWCGGQEGTHFTSTHACGLSVVSLVQHAHICQRGVMKARERESEGKSESESEKETRLFDVCVCSVYCAEGDGAQNHAA